MKTHKLLLALLFVGLLQFVSIKLVAGNLKTKPVIKLTSVFTKETDVKNKEILKLYEDLSYEFLFFEFYNKKPRVKREKGTYILKKQKLVLKNSGKTQPKGHSERFIIKENEGLFACNRFGKINISEQPMYFANTDVKFWQATYKDSVFGEITNDRKATRKIIMAKPNYLPIPISSQLKEEPALETEVNNIDKLFISRDSLKKLKAIIIVGPVEDHTKKFIDEQKTTALYLKNLGVQVFEFYHPNAKWADISKASEGANILVYAGHGSVSVFCVTNQIVESEKIISDLKLHKNALVILNHACESAGASAADMKEINQIEALRRVGDYAKTFVSTNGGAYYANNYDYTVVPFLESFFKRQSIKTIYTREASEWTKIEVLKKYKYDSNFEIGIASKAASDDYYIYTITENGKSTTKKIKDFKSYEVAYVGKPNYTVNDLFK